MNAQNSSGDLPVLRRWLDGASSHPLRWYFEYRRPGWHPSVVVAWWNNPILVAVEQTLTILETAAPVGLDVGGQEVGAGAMPACGVAPPAGSVAGDIDAGL